MTPHPRHGSKRQALKAEIRRTEPNCWLCGYPIDITLDPKRHPLGSSIDEVVPISRGGDPLDRANCRHSHRVCNGMKYNNPITAELRDRCRANVTALLRPRLRRW